MSVSNRTRTRLRRARKLRTGGDLKDSKASLCLYSPSLDVAKVKASLRCAPTYAVAKNQLRHPPHGSGPAPVGLWCLEAPRTLKLVEKLQYLLDATPKTIATWRRLAKSHDLQLRCGIFLHSWNEGFELPALVAAEIGARGWKLGLDIYSAKGDEIVEAFLTKPSKAQGR